MSRPRSASARQALTAARDRTVTAGYAIDAEADAGAEADADDAAQELPRLAVADAARQEWAEAHADKAEAARAAEAELRRRDLAGRIPQADTGNGQPQERIETEAEFGDRLHQMVLDAEAGKEAEARAAAGEPEPAAKPEAELEAEEAAQIDDRWPMTDAEFDVYLDELVTAAEERREAGPKAEPDAVPVPEPEPATEAAPEPELEAVPEPEPDVEPATEPQPAAGPAPEAEPVQLTGVHAEIAADLEHIGRWIREAAAQGEAAAAGRAEAHQEIRREPAAWAGAGTSPSQRPRGRPRRTRTWKRRSNQAAGSPGAGRAGASTSVRAGRGLSGSRSHHT